MENLTREFFDGLVIVVIAIGLVLAFFRLRADFTRPLPDDRESIPDPFDEEGS